jgi:hypothetical protein
VAGSTVLFGNATAKPLIPVICWSLQLLKVGVRKAKTCSNQSLCLHFSFWQDFGSMRPSRLIECGTLRDFAMLNPTNLPDTQEHVHSDPLDSMLAIAFGPRPGDSGFESRAYESNLAKATGILRGIVGKLGTRKTKDPS